MKTFFSVIIPLYNKESYIRRAIDSVLNQTYNNFELIIVDDGSIDSSLQIVESINDNRIKIFKRNSPGPGGYAARNLGIREAKGEWIAFLDADDEWKLDNLSNVYNVINSHSDAKIICSAWYSSNKKKLKRDSFSKNTQFKVVKKLSFYDYLKESIKGSRPVATNCVCIKNEEELVSDIFPSSRTKRSGDLYAWVTIIAHTKYIYWSPHISYISYRDTENMVSKGNAPSIKINQEMVFELEHFITKQEMQLLKKYANRLIRTAWFENRIRRNHLRPIFSYLFWKNDVVFCMVWTIVSFLPIHVLLLLRKIKTKLRISFV